MSGVSSALDLPAASTSAPDASSRPPTPPPKIPPPPPSKMAPPVPPKDVAQPSNNAFKGLLSFGQLPHWQQDNAYILTGYRPASYSVSHSLRSMFEVHNETVNINSHLLGALMFLVLPIWGFEISAWRAYVSSSTTHVPLTWLFRSPADVLPFLPFFIGAVICLTTSALFHALSNVSPEIARKGNQADYGGIVALISGSFVSSIYFGFTCWRFWQIFYSGMILILGVGCTIVSVDRRFRTPPWRPFRAGMFVMMGCSAVFPVAQGCAMFGWDDLELRIGGTQLVTQGVLYILGAGLYAVRSKARVKKESANSSIRLGGRSVLGLVGLILSGPVIRFSTCLLLWLPVRIFGV